MSRRDFNKTLKNQDIPLDIVVWFAKFFLVILFVVVILIIVFGKKSGVDKEVTTELIPSKVEQKQGPSSGPLVILTFDMVNQTYNGTHCISFDTAGTGYVSNQKCEG